MRCVLLNMYYKACTKDELRPIYTGDERFLFLLWAFFFVDSYILKESRFGFIFRCANFCIFSPTENEPFLHAIIVNVYLSGSLSGWLWAMPGIFYVSLLMETSSE